MSGHLNYIKYFDKVLRTQRLSHCYIIEGRGCATEIAQKIFCETEHSACGLCKACQQFLHQNTPDYVEITALGEKSIKDEVIESMLDFIVTKPFFAEYKVVNILGAERMTNRAQNRLLKSLEEPVSKVVFLLETLFPEQLLETIQSRAIRVKAAGEEQVVEISDDIYRIVELMATKSLGRRAEINDLIGKQREEVQSSFVQLIQLFRDSMVWQQGLALVRDKYYLQKIEQISVMFSAQQLLFYIALIDQLQRDIAHGANVEMSIDQMVLGGLE